MPRQRQRIVFCDCFDCRDRPAEPSLTPEQLDAATAAARQEPPPKALLIFTTGVVLADETGTNVDACTLPHCNLLVREGNLGLLATRNTQDASGLTPAVAELSQLLGVYQDVCRHPPPAPNGSDDGNKYDTALPSLAARFKGMQAAVASTSPSAVQVARRLGAAVPDRLCLGMQAPLAARESAAAPAVDDLAPVAPAATGPGSAATEAAQGAPSKQLQGVLPDPGSFARAVAEELGAAEGTTGRDLLLLHLDLDDLLSARRRSGSEAEGGPAGMQGTAAEAEAASDDRWDAACETLEWVDALMRGLLSLQEIRERTLLALLLSPAGQKLPPVPGQGAASLLRPGGMQIDPAAAVVTPRSFAQVGRGAGAGGGATAGAGAGLAALDVEELPMVKRPVQSFEILGLEKVDVALDSPVLVARRLPGVIRRDRAEQLGYREAMLSGGQGAILVDRLLPEIAYKIGRAPKYGA